jgi:hypothetical protein
MIYVLTVAFGNIHSKFLKILFFHDRFRDFMVHLGHGGFILFLRGWNKFYMRIRF